MISTDIKKQKTFIQKERKKISICLFVTSLRDLNMS